MSTVCGCRSQECVESQSGGTTFCSASQLWNLSFQGKRGGGKKASLQAFGFWASQKDLAKSYIPAAPRHLGLAQTQQSPAFSGTGFHHLVYTPRQFACWWRGIRRFTGIQQEQSEERIKAAAQDVKMWSDTWNGFRLMYTVGCGCCCSSFYLWSSCRLKGFLL